jgi:hypothetical protein
MKKAIVLLVCAIFIFNLGADGLSPAEDKMLSEISAENLSETIGRLVSFSPRLIGSGTMDDSAIGGDYEAAQFIETQLKSYGLETNIEPFDLRATQVYEYSLVVDFDGDPKTHDTIDLTANSAPFIPRSYWDNVTTINMVLQKKLLILKDTSEKQDTHDKILLASTYDLWKDNEKLLNEGASTPAWIAYTEGVPYTVIFNRYNVFSISEEDYKKILQKAGEQTTVFLTYKAELKASKGYNVIGKIDGRDDKELILTAHIDSVYSQGAIDNGSGISALLEVARVLSKYKFAHDIVFAFVDAEEVGGNGSEYYVSRHGNELKDALGAINVDCIASGTPHGMTVGFNHKYNDLMKRWGSFWENQSTDRRLDDFIRKVAPLVLKYEPQSMYVEYIAGGSDFGNFSAKGIPATDMGWINTDALRIPAVSEKKETDYSEIRWEVGGKKYWSTFGRFSEVIPYIHTLNDTPENVNMEYVLQTTKVLLVSAVRLARLDDGTQTGIGIVSVVILFFVVWIRHRNP